MRTYAKLSPTFWTGRTGRMLKRRGIEGVVVALYLVSSPHSNMLGLFYQPKLYLAEETGLTIEGASKGLQDCIECGFCSYDDETKTVWVHEMAAWQIDSALSSGDKRCKGIQRDYEALPDNPFLGAFFDRYAEAFHLTDRREYEGEEAHCHKAPSKPLTKPHRSQEQEQEQEQEPPKPPKGAGDGFADFWASWPRSERKGGKAECERVWKSGHLEQHAETIVAHVKAMAKTEGWTKQGGAFVPAPVVYLRGRRWDGAEVGSSGAPAPDDIFAGAL